ncbi:MAG: hypothetical protein AAGD23_01310 [Pseudomonadota bacterium]
MAEEKAARRTGSKSKTQGRAGSTAKSGTGSGSARAGARPKAVKPPTINLKAEEVSAKETTKASSDSATPAQPSTTSTKGNKAANAKVESAKADAPQSNNRPKEKAASQGASAPPVSNRLGLMGYAGAGAVGAIAAAAVSIAVNMIGVRTPDTSAIETRLEQIAAQNTDAVALQQQIDVLVARQTQLTEQIGAANDSADLAQLRSTLESSISDTQSELTILAEAISAMSVSGADADPEGLRSQISTLAARLDSAEERLGRIATSEDLSALQAVFAETTGDASEGAAGLSGLAQLGQQVSDSNEQLSARVDTMEPAVQGLSEAVAALEARIAESLGAGASMSDIEGLGDRIASIGGQLGEIRDSMAGAEASNAATDQLLADHEERLAALQTGLAELQTTIGTVQNRASSSAADQAATALALAEFQDAVQSSGDFVGPLNTLSAILGTEQPEMAVLAKHAEAGVLNTTELATRFEAVAGDIVAAASVREDAGILGRLVDNARGIVSVRPISPVSGDTPAAIVSRIAGHLADDSLDAAAGEWAALPEPARNAATDWGRQLSARIEVDNALDQLTARLLADLQNAASAAPATQ